MSERLCTYAVIYIGIYSRIKRVVMSNKGNNTALQSEKAVSAYMESKQLLPFGFARQYTVDILYHLCDINNLCNGFLSQYGTHNMYDQQNYSTEQG